MKKKKKCEYCQPQRPHFLTVLYEVKEEVMGSYGVKVVDEEKVQVVIAAELRCIRKLLEIALVPEDEDD